MPALARVVENVRRGDGTIESTVRVTAATEGSAKRQARRSALRHNGYSDLVLSSDESEIKVGVVEVESQAPIGLRETFVVKVELTGAGEYL